MCGNLYSGWIRASSRRTFSGYPTFGRKTKSCCRKRLICAAKYGAPRCAGTNMGQGLCGQIWGTHLNEYHCQEPFRQKFAQVSEFRTQTGEGKGHRIALECSILVLEHGERSWQRCARSGLRINGCSGGVCLCGEDYITGGTLMPIKASTRVSSRRTTAAVANKNACRS